jgi:hypothetical protein
LTRRSPPHHYSSCPPLRFLPPLSPFQNLPGAFLAHLPTLPAYMAALLPLAAPTALTAHTRPRCHQVRRQVSRASMANTHLIRSLTRSLITRDTDMTLPRSTSSPRTAQGCFSWTRLSPLLTKNRRHTPPSPVRERRITTSPLRAGRCPSSARGRVTVCLRSQVLDHRDQQSSSQPVLAFVRVPVQVLLQG